MSTTEANIYNHVLTVQNFQSKGDREMKYPKTPFYTIIGVITSPAIALALRRILVTRMNPISDIQNGNVINNFIFLDGWTNLTDEKIGIFE